jgi:hypothetical protein
MVIGQEIEIVARQWKQIDFRGRQVRALRVLG